MKSFLFSKNLSYEIQTLYSNDELVNYSTQFAVMKSSKDMLINSLNKKWPLSGFFLLGLGKFLNFINKKLRFWKEKPRKKNCRGFVTKCFGVLKFDCRHFFKKQIIKNKNC